MLDLALSCRVHAGLLPVSHRAVRAELHALDARGVSCRANPSPPEYIRESAWLARVSRRDGDACTCPTLPLLEGVQSTRAPADQMGGLRSHCADHGRSERESAVSDFPRGQ